MRSSAFYDSGFASIAIAVLRASFEVSASNSSSFLAALLSHALSPADVLAHRCMLCSAMPFITASSDSTASMVDQARLMRVGKIEAELQWGLVQWFWDSPRSSLVARSSWHCVRADQSWASLGGCGMSCKQEYEASIHLSSRLMRLSAQLSTQLSASSTRHLTCLASLSRDA